MKPVDIAHAADLRPAPLPPDFADRFWRKDPSLWPAGSSADVAGMLGWVSVLKEIEPRFAEIEEFVAQVRADGFRQVVLCGMGGSSLAPYVFAQVIGVQPGGLPVRVLDSTHPLAIREIEGHGVAETLFIVASKSGSTAEPTAFDSYFFDHVANPAAFVAITDPRSPFEASARARGFRKVFLNWPDIGGRYSALSLFGLVPAALLGIDIRTLVARAQAYAKTQTAPDSDAFQLGAIIGEAARNGRDKLTFLTDAKWLAFGLWLEQLIAESTGKLGRGTLPIAGETLGDPQYYGTDRLFVGVNQTPPDPGLQVDITDPLDLGAEFLRWEIATAVIGHVLEINPFDQPNVQESKDITKAIVARVESAGELTEEGVERLTEEALPRFLANIQPGDYIAIQAYLHETPLLNDQLHRLQAALRNRYGVAVTMGYGPRFLHSTGQFHKGGPAVGHYVQLVDEPVMDAPIPGQRLTWRQFVRAQAQGDRQALIQRGRPVYSVDLGSDPATAIQKLIP